MVFSATKGVAATVVHRLVDRGLLDYDTPVAEYWPEFGANGKSDITVRDVLRHRSGLSHLKGVTKDDLLDHHLMEERLAAAPADHLRGLPAYHALTYGWLVSGLCRAVTGMGMRELIRDEVARPLNTDGVHLGRPPAGSPTKVAQILIPQNARPNPVFDFVAPQGGRSAVLRCVRRDVLSRHQILCAGRHSVPRRRGPGRQRRRHRPWPGEDVRGDRQRRQRSTANSSFRPRWPTA